MTGWQGSSAPLYAPLRDRDADLLPMPCLNVLDRGLDDDCSFDFQAFMLVPVGAPTFAEAMRYAPETYAALRNLLSKRDLATSVGDEAAPPAARE